MRRLWGVAVLTAASCSPVATPAPTTPVGAGPEAPVGPDTAGALPPTGYGSLRQDEFSVEIQDVNMHVKITPLAESIIRLAAPDTYHRLQSLVRSRWDEAVAMTDAPAAELFLVSFFSRDPNVSYRPEELRITHRGRSLQPAGIVPLTTGWGRQLLQPQQTQSAIYVFEPPFDYDLPVTIRYGMQESDDWHRVVLPRLEEERVRVESRSGVRATAGSRTP
ncbi:MAG: hypothetical protein R3314_11200 [Longimicrobiales bacterium]|nr:hypothetical protein [Longimicrobiales bacterium]